MDNARRVQASLFDHTNGTSSGYSERLNGSANEKFGIARSIMVMPGDTIRLEVYGKYVDANSSNWTPALTSLMSQVSAGAAGVVIDGVSYSSSTSTFPTWAVQSTAGSTGGPKAYLNWMIFDMDFTFVSAGYTRMSATPKEQGQDVAHERLYSPNIVISQPGLLYAYLSNEETTPVEVYFDDFKVTQVHSRVVSGADYYPFGLPIAERAITQEPYRFGYQGQFSEKDLTTGWNEFDLRMYDARFGRWLSPDPMGQFASSYVGMGNEPVGGVDSDGGFNWGAATARALQGFVVGSAIGLAVDSDNWWKYGAGVAAAGAIYGGATAEVTWQSSNKTWMQRFRTNFEYSWTGKPGEIQEGNKTINYGTPDYRRGWGDEFKIKYEKPLKAWFDKAWDPDNWDVIKHYSGVASEFLPYLRNRKSGSELRPTLLSVSSEGVYYGPKGNASYFTGGANPDVRLGSGGPADYGNPRGRLPKKDYSGRDIIKTKKWGDKETTFRVTIYFTKVHGK